MIRSNEKIRVGFLTGADPMDRRSWSGIYYHMLKSLEKQDFEIIILGPLGLNKYFQYVITFIIKINIKIHNLFGKKYNVSHNHLSSILHGKFFEKKLKQNNVDIIFAPTSSN